MTNISFTCILCNISFYSSEIQRLHYKSEWHLYNLKRKIAGFPTVSAHVFSEKVFAKKNIQNNEENLKLSNTKKKKNIHTNYDTFDNDLSQSIPSYELKKSYDKTDADDMFSKQPINTLSNTFHHMNLQSLSNEIDDDETLIKKRIEEAPRLKITDCLFCTLTFPTLNENLEHMKKSHSLFIPEQEYLIDLEGLIQYLGEKISIGNVCLSCEKVGKSLESIRQHMFSKGHCFIAYDTEENKLELSDYYDFRSSYPTRNDDSDWEDISSDQDSDDSSLSTDFCDNTDIMIEDGCELILPSKIRLGHRSLIRYYQQNLNTRNFQRKTGDRNRSGLVRREYVQRSLQGVSESRRKFSQKHIKTFQDTRYKENYKTKVSLKNNYQKYFRNELLQ